MALCDNGYAESRLGLRSAQVAPTNSAAVTAGGNGGRATLTTPAIESTAQSAAAPWPARARRAGWALLACWVLLIVAAVFAGERSSSLPTLRDAVASGDVTVVHVAGGLPDGAGSRGYSALDLRWRNGGFAYYAVVREARPLKAAPLDDDIQVVTAGVVDRLVASQPELRVVRLPGNSYPSFTGSVLGWRLPQGLAWAGLLLFPTLGLLIAGPQPWRATRWAWFWVLGIAAPIGVLAYLVFAGPTALSHPPRPGTRQLTGGWAFLLTLVVWNVLGAR